jgi:hypothetical protein
LWLLQRNPSYIFTPVYADSKNFIENNISQKRLLAVAGWMKKSYGCKFLIMGISGCYWRLAALLAVFRQPYSLRPCKSWTHKISSRPSAFWEIFLFSSYCRLSEVCEFIHFRVLSSIARTKQKHVYLREEEEKRIWSVSREDSEKTRSKKLKLFPHLKLLTVTSLPNFQIIIKSCVEKLPSELGGCSLLYRWMPDDGLDR